MNKEKFVTLVLDNGNIESGENDSFEVISDYESRVTIKVTNECKLPKPKKKGFTFKGWTKDSKSSGSEKPVKKVIVTEEMEDNTTYVANWKPSIPVLVWILIALILSLLIGGYLYIRYIKDNISEPVGTVIIQDSEEDEDATNPLKDLYVTYSGITDTNILADSVIELENLKENGDIVMKFTIYEGSKKLYESDYIKSGSHINWEIGKVLNKGEHTLKVVQTPRIEVDGRWVPLTSGTCECTLTRF